MAEYRHIESALIHGGIYGDKTTGAVNVPIYQTSTYEQQGLGQNTGWEYSRTGNPTRAALEALIAELEGGTAGFAFASGLAAITTVLSLFQAGDRILISSNVYGGTFRLLEQVFRNFGIGYAIADTAEPPAFEAAITPEVKKVYYPGLPDAQGYEINRRQAKNGGAMISFELDEKHDIRKFFSSLKLIALAESLGGVESLVCHPATMTHASIPKDIREAVGITDGLIRLSIGIENIDDLLRDLEQAIKESEVKSDGGI